MFSPRLDSPPPSRHLPHHRPRPWSPDQNDPFSALRQPDNVAEHDDDDLYRTSIPLDTQRREASDVSVEALDLADYARTLRTRQTDGPYPAFPSRSLDDFPPSSYVPATRDSRDTLSPPSLISRGPTLSSSNATSRSNQRPFSLPSRHHLSQPFLYHPQPRIADSQSHIPSSEIDISQFPAWSRSWYQSTNRVDPHSSSPPIDDLYTAIPHSNFLDPYKKKKKSVFDPGYIHYHEQDYDPLTDPSSLSDPIFAPPHSSMTHESTRDLLPWSHHGLDDGESPVDPLTKEERMRMLEKEFGQDRSDRKRGLGDFVDEDGKPLIGTVDTQGYLVTQGPKKRTATRIFQILFALGAGIPAIYAAIAIKPDPLPPPAGKPQAFVLYVISIFTFLLLFYLFFVRPCCCSPRRKNKGALDDPLSRGMMVLPIPSGAGSKKKNKHKKKKKGGGGLGGGDGDVQVNLIIDPHVFSGGNDSDGDDEDDSDTNSNMPGGYYTPKQTNSSDNARSKRKKNQRRRRRRRSVFMGLAMEEEWRRARGWARKMAFVDGVGILVWGAVFIFVMIGQRCPVGKFDGWCNAYNVSTACACLLCIAFGVSVFFDVKDLYASRTSPRTRI